MNSKTYAAGPFYTSLIRLSLSLSSRPPTPLSYILKLVFILSFDSPKATLFFINFFFLE